MDFLINNINLLELPSTLWGVHIDPEFNYLGILRMCLVDKQVHIDRSMLFSNDEEGKGIKASTFLERKEIFLAENNCSIDQFSEINELLLKLEGINKCANFENAEYPSCVSFTYGERIYCENCCEIKQEVGEEIEVEIEYGCLECSLTFKSNRALKKHLGRHKIGIDEYINCNVCALTVKSNNINDHMFTHNTDKPYRCKYCVKTFAKRYNLKMHENIHLGARPFMCNHCGKSFSAQSNLKSHISYSHENRKAHVCQICDKAFVHPRILRIHMRKHTGEKPFACGFCGKGFSQNVHRQVHMRSHTGEKPYVCLVCNKGFITSGNLDWHKKSSNHDKQNNN